MEEHWDKFGTDPDGMGVKGPKITKSKSSGMTFGNANGCNCPDCNPNYPHPPSNNSNFGFNNPLGPMFWGGGGDYSDGDYSDDMSY